MPVHQALLLILIPELNVLLLSHVNQMLSVQAMLFAMNTSAVCALNQMSETIVGIHVRL